MNWQAPVDLYCERLGPGLFAEPFNALSNLAFIGASLWLLRRLRGLPENFWYASILAALIFFIGLGSLAFHTFAQVWAEVLDVGSIALFIYFFVACFFHRFFGLPWWIAVLGLPAFWAFGKLVAVAVPVDSLNGSASYLPALLALLLMALALAGRRIAAAGYLASAAAVFAVSLALRTMDQAWCARFPLGTHWLWHGLNAATLSLVVLALTQNARPGSR